MQYTTVVKLRTYLGLDSDSDALLDLVIKRCTQQFDKYLGRNLGMKTYTQYVDCENDTFVILANGPVKEINMIKFDDETGADVPVKRKDGNMVYLTSSIDGTLFVEYQAGYDTLDDILDVEQACLEMCKDLWDSTPSSGNEVNIKSKQIETLSKTYFSRDEMSGGIGITFRETLDNYKSFLPMIV